jgi:hypothetical protein
MWNFKKIHLVGVTPFHVDGWTHKMKLTVVFTSHLVSMPDKTAVHLSMTGTPSVWHYTTQIKMSLPFSKGRLDLQINLVHVLPLSFRVEIISTISHLHRSCTCILPVSFLNQNFECNSHSSIHATYPTHQISLTYST